jgi:hypothetical protein
MQWRQSVLVCRPNIGLVGNEQLQRLNSRPAADPRPEGVTPFPALDVIVPVPAPDLPIPVHKIHVFVLRLEELDDRIVVLACDGVMKRLSRLPWEFGLRPGNR